MLETCGGCGHTILLGGITSHGKRYCDWDCRKFASHPGFCPRCQDETLPVSSGGLYTFHGVGAEMYGRSDPCSTCGSVVRRRYMVFLLIPIVPLHRYRVIEGARGSFLSRRVRPGLRRDSRSTTASPGAPS